MINITLKCHMKKKKKKNICKKVHNFHHCLTWFLALIFVLAPFEFGVYLLLPQDKNWFTKIVSYLLEPNIKCDNF